MSTGTRWKLEQMSDNFRRQAEDQIGPVSAVCGGGCRGGAVPPPARAKDVSPLPAAPWTGPERRLQAACEVVLKRMGYPYYHAHDSRRSNPGWPDLIVMLPAGRVAFIELKNAKGKMSKDQLAFMAAAIKDGHYYGVARSPEQMMLMVAEAEELTGRSISNRCAWSANGFNQKPPSRARSSMEGSQIVETLMLRVSIALDKHFDRNHPGRVEIYNRCYEAVTQAVNQATALAGKK